MKSRREVITAAQAPLAGLNDGSNGGVVCHGFLRKFAEIVMALLKPAALTTPDAHPAATPRMHKDKRAVFHLACSRR